LATRATGAFASGLHLGLNQRAVEALAIRLVPYITAPEHFWLGKAHIVTESFTIGSSRYPILESSTQLNKTWRTTEYRLIDMQLSRELIQV